MAVKRQEDGAYIDENCPIEYLRKIANRGDLIMASVNGTVYYLTPKQFKLLKELMQAW